MPQPKNMIWIGALAVLIAWSSLAPSTPHQNATDDLLADGAAQIQLSEHP